MNVTSNALAESMKEQQIREHKLWTNQQETTDLSIKLQTLHSRLSNGPEIIKGLTEVSDNLDLAQRVILHRAEGMEKHNREFDPGELDFRLYRLCVQLHFVVRYVATQVEKACQG